jgi:hypothetical protein
MDLAARCAARTHLLACFSHQLRAAP